jgi:hypothetical protein
MKTFTLALVEKVRALSHAQKNIYTTSKNINKNWRMKNEKVNF